jgi:hypothetical protein
MMGKVQNPSNSLIICSVLGPHFLHSNFFQKYPQSSPSLEVRNSLSYPYKPTYKLVLYIAKVAFLLC